MAKQLNTRIRHKIDTATNWQAIETTFKPLSGELIIYTYPDTPNKAPQIKIGEGEGDNAKTLSQLEFIKGGLDEETINQRIADQIGSPVNDTGIYAKVYTKEEVDTVVSNKAPMYRYSTQDITEDILQGLEPGSLYLVYEDPTATTEA